MSDVYEDALRKLVREEVITPAAVKKITGLDLESPTEEMIKAAGLLHTMLCEMCGEGCTFIQEEQREDPWSMTSHMIWLSNAKDIANMYKLDDEAFLNTITAATSGLQNVSTFSRPALSILIKFIKVHLRQAQRAATAPARKDDQGDVPLGEFADQELD